MNSDKFDRVVLDLLYEELDELTTLAAKRHMEQSARARDIFAHLKVTRRLSVLPLHPAPDGFEASVLVREPGARAEFPVRYRVGRFVSMLAGYAMRPQLAMGTLLLLMIGSSLLFLRAKPGHHGTIQVTERGVPEAEAELVVPVALAEAPTISATGTSAVPAAPAEGSDPAGRLAAGLGAGSPQPPGAMALDAGSASDPFNEAVRAYRSGHYVEAQRLFERLSRAGGPQAAEAALYSAQSTRNASGCGAAISRFERVRIRFPASGAANEAVWRAAKCLQKLGDLEAARQSFESLLGVPAYARDARRALLELEGKVEEAPASGDAPGLKAARLAAEPGAAAAGVSGSAGADAGGPSLQRGAAESPR